MQQLPAQYSRFGWLAFIAVICLMGCARKAQTIAGPTPVQVRLTSDRPLAGFPTCIQAPRGEDLYLASSALINERHVASARQVRLQGGGIGISCALTPEGQNLLEASADQYVGKYLAVLLWDEVVQVVLVHVPLRERFVLSPGPDGFTQDQADQIIASFGSAPAER